MTNWKPVAIAAIIVAVIGIGAGVVIAGGGGDETTTVTATTTTAADTTEATEATTSDSTATDETTTTAEDPSAPAGATPFATAFSPKELRSNQGNGLDQCVSAGSGAETRSLAGESLTDATILNVIYQNRTLCDRWLVILPVGDYSSLEIGGIGWADRVPETASATFSIYGDSRGSEPLFTDEFDGGGSNAPASTSLDLSGTENLILEWKNLGESTDLFAGNFTRYRFVLNMAYIS